MTRNRDRLEQNATPRPINVIALAEDWNGEVVANLPILGRLARESNGKLNVRVHLRDQEPGSPIMDKHLNKGHFRSIPTLVFFDENFHEVGVWVERPESVTRLREDKRLALYAQHPRVGRSKQADC